MFQGHRFKLYAQHKSIFIVTYSIYIVTSSGYTIRECPGHYESKRSQGLPLDLLLTTMNHYINSLKLLTLCISQSHVKIINNINKYLLFYKITMSNKI